MRIRATVAALLLLALSAGPAAAEGSTVLYGPVNGHRAFEIGTTLSPVIVSIWIDDFDAGAATQPSFIGDLDGSQGVLELGAVRRLGPAKVGVGIRTWMSRLEGTQQYLRTYWTDSLGREVSYDVSHDGFGNLLPGYQEHQELATRRATAEQDSGTELAVLVAGSAEFGRWLAAGQASYAASGFAWRVTGGYRLGDVVLTAGYRFWPMKRFYDGPVLGVELRF